MKGVGDIVKYKIRKLYDKPKILINRDKGM